jgi:hypothetical protein
MKTRLPSATSSDPLLLIEPVTSKRPTPLTVRLAPEAMVIFRTVPVTEITGYVVTTGITASILALGTILQLQLPGVFQSELMLPVQILFDVTVIVETPEVAEAHAPLVTTAL